MALATRERLVGLIEVMPGIHLRLAQRVLGVSIGTTVYHVRALLQERRIREEREGRYLRLYMMAASQGNVSEDLAKAFWKSMSSGERIRRALVSGPIRLVDVARRAGVSKQLAHYHLGRVVGAEVVRTVVDNGCKRYALKARSNENEGNRARRGKRSGQEALSTSSSRVMDTPVET